MVIIKRYILFIILTLVSAALANVFIPDAAFSQGIPIFLFNTRMIINIHLVIIILIGMFSLFVPMRNKKWKI